MQGSVSRVLGSGFKSSEKLVFLMSLGADQDFNMMTGDSFQDF